MKPTQEQVIAWAQEGSRVEFPASLAGVKIGMSPEHLERFAALAYEAGRKDENEACAKEAENRWLNKANCTAEEMYEMLKKSIAEAIRARRKQ